MTFKPQNSGAALMYLNQRSFEERAAEANRENARLQRARDWLTEYHKRGQKTSLNRSPTITGTTTTETTSEKGKEVVGCSEEENRGGGQSQLEETQGERRFDRKDGDTPF